MDIRSAWIIVTLPVCLCLAARAPECVNEKKCRIQSVYKMSGADCYDRDFKTFPKCLPSDIQVIDSRHNRIRKVSNADLMRYPYLTYLYLEDNLIFNLEDNTFAYLNNLVSLDLSDNALARVPKSIFQLPSLEKLFLSQNANINMIDSIEKAQPIISPIGLLNISYTTDESNIYDFPSFGVMPFLIELDISGNIYSNMNRTSFLGMCQLKVLHTENVTVDFQDLCDCWIINSWLRSQDVDFKLFECRIDQAACTYLDIEHRFMEDHSNCKLKVSGLVLAARIRKLSIGITVVAFFIILILLCYFWKCYNRRAKKTWERPEDNNLLNNQQKSQPNEYV